MFYLTDKKIANFAVKKQQTLFFHRSVK